MSNIAADLYKSIKYKEQYQLHLTRDRNSQYFHLPKKIPRKFVVSLPYIIHGNNLEEASKIVSISISKYIFAVRAHCRQRHSQRNNKVQRFESSLNFGKDFNIHKTNKSTMRWSKQEHKDILRMYPNFDRMNLLQLFFKWGLRKYYL